MQQQSIENWKHQRPLAGGEAESVCLWLVHIETGRYLDDEGHYCGTTKYYDFDHVEAASVRKDELLDRFPFACVYIGHPDDAQSAKFNSPKIGEFTKEKRRWMAWKSHGFIKRMLRPEPILSAFDPARDPSVRE